MNRYVVTADGDLVLDGRAVAVGRLVADEWIGATPDAVRADVARAISSGGDLAAAASGQARPADAHGARSKALDAVRGWAIVLMLVDHSLAVASAPGLTRWTITRASLPMFMVVSGWLLQGRSGPSGKRCIQLGGAAVLSAGASQAAGLGAPDILAVFAAALCIRWLLYRCGATPLMVMAASLVVLSWGVVSWDGYDPFLVLGLVELGGLARAAGVPIPQLPAARAVVWMGRRPLSIFVVQAWFFAAIAGAVR